MGGDCVRRRKKKNGFRGIIHYWYLMLILTMEALHQRAFRERGIFKRIFRADKGLRTPMAYLPPHDARRQVRGTHAEDRVGLGQDAFLVGVHEFPPFLKYVPSLYAKALGVNGKRPIPKRLLIALLALHECRHKASHRGLVRRVSPRSIAAHLDGHLRKGECAGFARFLRRYMHVFCCLPAVKKRMRSRDELDASVVEALGLYVWECRRIRGLSLITKHFPRMVLLARR